MLFCSLCSIIWHTFPVFFYYQWFTLICWLRIFHALSLQICNNYFSFWRYIEIVWTTLNFSVCTFVSGFYSAGYIWYSCLFLLRWQSHCMKLTILKCTIWWHLIIHSSVKPPPLPSSRMFSSPQKENLCPFSSPLHSSFPSVACNHQSASYLCYPIVDILYNCCCTIRNLLYFCLAAFS